MSRLSNNAAEKKNAEDEKEKEEESDDAEYMFEIDPIKRNQKRLRWKAKQLKAERIPPLARLSDKRRGWNAPDDKPYVPVGQMTEMIQALEAIKRELPHTDPRYNKETYRSIL